MNIKDYFNDWYPHIDQKSLNLILSYLSKESTYFPNATDVFRVFTLCKARNTVAIFLGQGFYEDQYKGILFGNDANTTESNISNSLELLKEAAINYEIPHNYISFDNTLESWVKQGILMLNTSLTFNPKTPNSHSLYWRLFISNLLQIFSKHYAGVVYVLFGKQAQSFTHYINPKNSLIIEVEHPGILAKNKEKLSNMMFKNISKHIKDNFNLEIQWFLENK